VCVCVFVFVCLCVRACDCVWLCAFARVCVCTRARVRVRVCVFFQSGLSLCFEQARDETIYLDSRISKRSMVYIEKVAFAAHL